MTRSTAMTAASGAALVTAAVGVVWSIAALDDGALGVWKGTCAAAGVAATAGLYLLGRAHEAARCERRVPR